MMRRRLIRHPRRVLTLGILTLLAGCVLLRSWIQIAPLSRLSNNEIFFHQTGSSPPVCQWNAENGAFLYRLDLSKKCRTGESHLLRVKVGTTANLEAAYLALF